MGLLALLVFESLPNMVQILIQGGPGGQQHQTTGDAHTGACSPSSAPSPAPSLSLLGQMKAGIS